LRLAQLHTAEDGLRAIPTPPQAKLVEPDIETRLRTNQVLEGRTMLRHPGDSQLVRQHDNTEEHQRTGQDEGGHSQSLPGRLRRRG
jgi:hypothetical protein